MTSQADQQPFDENRQVITRNDLFKILNRLETRVSTLQTLIESRIEEQQDGKSGQPLIKCFRSLMANFYFNAIFRTHVLLFTVLQIMLNIGIILILESLYLHFWQLQIVVGIMIAFTSFFLITTLLVSIEQIMMLIKRKAQLMAMICLYMSTTCLFGMLYTEIEIISPGSFSGVSYNDYNLVLRPVQLLLDLLYFSNIAQASVGFGDISPQASYTRFIALIQALFSVAFLTILFSNWVS